MQLTTANHRLLSDLDTRPFNSLALLINEDWYDSGYLNVASGEALAYLGAMFELGSIHDTFNGEDGESIVEGFLSYTSSWCGYTARVVRDELKRRLKEAL